MHLDYMNDLDCIHVAEFIIHTQYTAEEAKAITLHAFLMDILVCIGDEHGDYAATLRNKIEGTN